jgi:hypothetical protein
MKDFRKLFKDAARVKQISSLDITKLCIYKAITAKSDTPKAIIANQLLRRAYTPISRKIRLDNGSNPYDALVATLQPTSLQSSPGLETPEELKQYNDIILELRKKYIQTREESIRQYVYIFVRQDISPEYQLVQSAHAAAKMGFEMHKNQMHPDVFGGLYFACIGVPDIKGLKVAMDDAHSLGATTYPFYEPDIGNELTAVATSPILASERKRLLSYKRLVFK